MIALGYIKSLKDYRKRRFLINIDPNKRITSTLFKIDDLLKITKDKIIPYDVDSHKALFQKEMEERGFSQYIINDWLSYL